MHLLQTFFALHIFSIVSGYETNNGTSTTDDLYMDEYKEAMMSLHSNQEDLWYHLDCDNIFKEEELPIHSIETWQHARQVYKKVMGDESTSNDDQVQDGFQVAHEVKRESSEGRRLFAAQDIKKGQLIWSTKKTVRFGNDYSYRKFILGLENREFACDALDFTYVHDGNLLSIDLDDGSMCENGEEDANVGCDEVEAIKYRGGCTDHYFALRDIQAGEELLCGYYEIYFEDETRATDEEEVNPQYYMATK
jgi:hypothetical protein